ncbi:uncharacterized protein LOC133402850 isoform X1 [Phycodurus eques]|uniref:uncharacterized protein LOC133402850 isoform X1 n=1 Tax=Phycodurus eques TaxID=693459 RepID=UPI002ACE2DDB|nr:uncharacterized protein LOC133402850 isoform X1 [Phycodurus eques]
MGGNSPSHLHHDEGEGGGVTLVEGIRLSDRVIKRMRQKPVTPPPPSPSPPPHADSTDPTSSVEHLLPLLTAPPPAQEGPPAPGHLPGKRGPPPRVTFQPPPPATTPVGPVPAPPPLPVESILLPPNGTTTHPPTPPAEPAPAPPAPPVESIHLPPTQPTPPLPPQVDQAPEPPESILLPPSESTPPPPPPVESVLLAPVAPPPPPCCPGVNLAAVVPTHEGPSESFTPPPAKEPPPFLEAEKEVAAFVQAAPPAGAASLVSPEVFEKEVRRKMKEEMDRGLQKEIERRTEELQLQLEAMRAQSHTAAGSRAEVAERVKAALEADKAAYEAGLRRAVADERRGTEDERLVMQLYARQLEEKEEALRRRGALYEGRIVKLEAKCTDFYKATAESFQKGKEDAHRRFTRFNIQPVCGDLQSQVLKCYQEQPGKSLCCSGIASAYMRCVQRAKQSQPSTAR